MTKTPTGREYSSPDWQYIRPKPWPTYNQTTKQWEGGVRSVKSAPLFLTPQQENDYVEWQGEIRKITSPPTPPARRGYLIAGFVGSFIGQGLYAAMRVLGWVP